MRAPGGCTKGIEYTYEVIEDLITNDARHLEALLGSNRVYNHVAMDANEMLGVEDTVLVLRRDISSANSSRRLKVWMSQLVQRALSGCSVSWWGIEMRDAMRGERNPQSTWPAVSIISVAKSWFLYRIILLNVFSIVG
jgi:hypothetical protein